MSDTFCDARLNLNLNSPDTQAANSGQSNPDGDIETRVMRKPTPVWFSAKWRQSMRSLQ
jgi:hypothetical protein